MISRNHDSAHRLGAGSPLLARAEVQLRTDPGRFPAPILLNQQVLTTAPGTHARPPHGDGWLRAAAGRRQNARRPCPQGRHTDRSTHRPIDHRATINEEGGITPTTAGGTPYRRADEAGAVAHGTKTRQGVNEWHAEDEAGAHVSPRALRDRAVVAAAL
ncbi:hypothetical protein [Streptomyces sp. NRRL S-4]|uniref:hypothetical protein n=1 Tax=Streptomyces sp. NRRL S-4 TaxID=1519471 RepID=UPI000B012B24|nr:hypothetical protein [Streptomyces sp. NRRL S-4]